MVQIYPDKSDEFLLGQNLLESSVALPSGPDKAGNGDNARFSKVDGAVGVDLGAMMGTSQMESWMEEWSLEVRMRSVKSHLRGR